MSVQQQRKDEDVEQQNDEESTDEQQGLSLGGRHVLTASPLIWVLLVGALAWAVWATVTRGSSSNSSMRAVVVPTAGADRLVVALSCSTQGASSSSGKQPPATSLTLPAGSGLRVVLIPGCQGASSSGGAGGGSGGSSSSPVGVVVLPPGTQPPRAGSSAPTSVGGSKPKVSAVFQVPSWARTLVITPCRSKQGASSGHASVFALGAGHGVLVVPPCGG
jgi:hypothetical protein